jgi:hypothetical protein
MAAKIAIIAITTSNSMRVKPLRFFIHNMILLEMSSYLTDVRACVLDVKLLLR